MTEITSMKPNWYHPKSKHPRPRLRSILPKTTVVRRPRSKPVPSRNCCPRKLRLRFPLPRCRRCWSTPMNSNVTFAWQTFRLSGCLNNTQLCSTASCRALKSRTSVNTAGRIIGKFWEQLGLLQHFFVWEQLNFCGTIRKLKHCKKLHCNPLSTFLCENWPFFR